MNLNYERILQYFTYEHLPEHLQAISKPCAELAHKMATFLVSDSAEVTVGLRKLLEAKDCFVRAGLKVEVLEELDIGKGVEIDFRADLGSTSCQWCGKIFTPGEKVTAETLTVLWGYLWCNETCRRNHILSK